MVSIFCERWLELPSGPRVFVLLAADYGNIGDLAITAAQRNFIARAAPSHHIVPVPISATREVIRSLRRQVVPGDLVTIIGGGNMGSLYPDIEELRQLAIRTFPNNRIVCFPQSLDWTQSPESDTALARITATYSKHPDIHVFARESVSRDKLRALFADHANVHIGYVPDVVLNASAAELGFDGRPEPSGILLCMRDDRERSLAPEQLAQLRKTLEDTAQGITVTDTHAGGARLDEAHCAHLLADKLAQFAGARLVVTDRLHGMILSLVAGTPCLVLPNSNHKIRQTWQDWLCDVPQLRFVEPEQFPELPAVVDALLAAPRRDPGLPPLDLTQYDSLQLRGTHELEILREGRKVPGFFSPETYWYAFQRGPRNLFRKLRPERSNVS
ncbi:polysaccharide pyruvyl transferase family protein [Luteimonas arsenica]|uniref:polysaccharide pyruvyl transferase family protein n=1 Tax=Luteimonas arsenica TaxID=1586242 RepID=UPI0014049027|nr:polysaccharide pyruvyl transferase family protein [Luteimonas arsenica]